MSSVHVSLPSSIPLLLQQKDLVHIINLSLPTFILNFKAVFEFKEHKKAPCDSQIDYLPSACLDEDRHVRIKKASTLLKH